MKIAIIGAGAAGLCALKNCLEQKQTCIVYEQTEKIGGTWNYTDEIQEDSYGQPIHTSMYQGLRTNVPKELMVYNDFPYENEPMSYIEQHKVLEYIHRYSNTFNLKSHIKFLHQVVEVTPIKNTSKWNIKVKNLRNPSENFEEEVYDAVLVGNGHYFKPQMPHIQSLSTFNGTWIHSHSFRKPDVYRNRNVLVLGAGPSAQDITRILTEAANKVFASRRSTVPHKFTNKVLVKPWIEEFRENSVLFTDGTEEIIEDVIFCTGYQYSFPFLSPECGIEVVDRCVQPLYKHLINIEHPSMGFLAIPFLACPFLLVDLQTKFFLELLKGNINISKEEMLADVQADKDYRKSLGYPPSHAHKLGKDQSRYFDELATKLNMETMPPVYQKLYDYVRENKNFDDVFQIVNDREYVQLA